MVEVPPEGEEETTAKPGPDDQRIQKEAESGRDRAREYFQERQSPTEPPPRATRSPASEGGATPRYLAIHAGTFFSDKAYRWGTGEGEDVGKLNAGVTYRMGEWVNSMDLAMRIDYTSFELNNDDARKLSLGAIITFPDANSRFPLYFGGGLGMGFFLKQIEDESPLALDYSIFGGVRLLDVIGSVGFLVEMGLKNHVLLLSEGQFNGVFINVGTVFAF